MENVKMIELAGIVRLMSTGPVLALAVGFVGMLIWNIAVIKSM